MVVQLVSICIALTNAQSTQRGLISVKSLAGHYAGRLLFDKQVRDPDARSLVSSAKLNLEQTGSFQFAMGGSQIVGQFEVSGRFVVLHFRTFNGVDAKKARGASRTVIDQVFEVSADGKALSFANAEPGSAALKFVRV